MASEGKRYVLNGLLVVGKGSIFGSYICFCFSVVIGMFVFYLSISINVCYIKDNIFKLSHKQQILSLKELNSR